MNDISLYYSPEENNYYWTGINNCTKCKQELSSISFLLWDFWRTHFKQLIYCDTCRAEILKAGGKYTEFKQVVLSCISDLPKDIEACFTERPNLVNSRNVSTFDVAIKSLEGEKVIDKTIQSHNPDFMMMEGVKSERQLLEDLNKSDKRLSLEDVDKLASDDVVLLGSRFELEDEEERQKELAYDKAIEEQILKKKGLLI